MRAFCENSHLFRQSWVFAFFPLKVVLCVKKCDLSRYTWLLLDRLLRLSHFCTRNAASLTVLDQALMTAYPVARLASIRPARASCRAFMDSGIIL